MNWKGWLGIIISLAFLFIVFHDADFEQIAESLKQANYAYLVVGAGLGLFSYGLRAIRWKFLLLPTKEISFQPLFTATVIGFMANNVLPVRIGEFVRAYVLSRDENVKKSSAFATLVVERIFDGLTLIAILVLASMATPVPNWVRDLSYLASLLFTVALLFMVALVVRPEWVRRVAELLTGRLSQRIQSRLITLIESFISGLGMLKSGRLWVIVTILSFAHWIFVGFTFQIGMAAFDMDIPILGPYLVLSIIALGIALPSSPGFVGTFQFFAEKGLSVYGVPANVALSFAIAFHIINYIPLTSLGLFLFWRKNITWSEIRRTEEAVEASRV